jgi:membrane associated rhomboid family serine protease
LSKTNYIIFACIVATLLLWIASLNEANVDYWAFSTENLLRGRVWTLFTALFIHADILHLAGNMLFLYVFGNTLEKEVGASKTVIAFFAGGVLAFLLGTPFFASSTFIIGASAAIFTLTATVMLIKPLKFSFFFLMPVGLVAIIYLVYNVVAIQMGVESNVAYISHLIGFGVGIPFGIKWGQQVLRNILITVGLFIIYLIIVILVIPFVLQSI